MYVNFYIAANKGSWLGFGVDFIFIFEIHASALASEPNRYDMLLDVNLVLWVFNLIKELIRLNQLERVLIIESG